MNEPILRPGQSKPQTAPSQAQLDAEAESFMALMAQHKATTGKG